MNNAELILFCFLLPHLFNLEEKATPDGEIKIKDIERAL